MNADDADARGDALIRAEKEAVRKAAGMMTMARAARQVVPVAQTLATPRGGDRGAAPTAEARAEKSGKCGMTQQEAAKMAGSADDSAQARANVALIKHDIQRLLEDLENLVWWTCNNETQKQTWQGLLGEVRSAVRKLESQANEAMSSTEGLLEAARAELEELRDAERKRTLLPPWTPDADAPACARCEASFNFLFRRRHHCRCCGEVVCSSCSPHVSPVPQWGYQGPVRVCDRCFGASNEHASLASTPRTALLVSSSSPSPVGGSSFRGEAPAVAARGVVLDSLGTSPSPVSSTRSRTAASSPSIRASMHARRARIAGEEDGV